MILGQSIFNERKAIFENEIKGFKKGIFFFYFGTSDSLQHWSKTKAYSLGFGGIYINVAGGTIIL